MIMIIIIIELWMSQKYTCIKLVIPTFKNKFEPHFFYTIESFYRLTT